MLIPIRDFPEDRGSTIAIKSVKVMRLSDKAAQIEMLLDGATQALWLPKSQIKTTGLSVGYQGELVITRWIAEAKGIATPRGHMQRNNDTTILPAGKVNNGKASDVDVSR